MSVDDDLNALTQIEPITREDLIERIIRLLNTSPERLMAILYRVDVSEKRIHEIFDNAFPTEIPELLADELITRQREKARTRQSNKATGRLGDQAIQDQNCEE